MICFTCLTVADPEPTQQLYSLDPEPTQELYSPDPAKEDRLQAAQALEAVQKRLRFATLLLVFFSAVAWPKIRRVVAFHASPNTNTLSLCRLS